MLNEILGYFSRFYYMQSRRFLMIGLDHGKFIAFESFLSQKSCDEFQVEILSRKEDVEVVRDENVQFLKISHGQFR